MMPLGESHGASHFADGRFVELADRLPLELGHIAVEHGGAHQGHRHLKFQAFGFGGGRNVPTDFQKLHLSTGNTLIVILVLILGLVDRDAILAGLVGVGFSADPVRGHHIPVFGVVAVPRFVAIHIGRLQRISLKLRVRFDSGRIGDGDVGDVRKIVFVDFVGLIQLLPRLVLASTVQLHVDVLGDLEVAVGLHGHLIVEAAVRQFRVIGGKPIEDEQCHDEYRRDGRVGDQRGDDGAYRAMPHQRPPNEPPPEPPNEPPKPLPPPEPKLPKSPPESDEGAAA